MIRIVVFTLILNLFIYIYSFLISNDDLSIGWPYIYYHQFKVSGNSFLNYGWNITNFILDQIIIILISILLLIAFYILSKYKKN